MIVGKIPVPQAVKVSAVGPVLTVEGPKGKLERAFSAPGASLAVKGREIVVTTHGGRRHDKALIGTWRGHLNNMFDGVAYGLEYRLKIVYTHFPIKAVG